MSFSQSVGKSVAVWSSLVFAIPSVVFGQGNFLKSGGEFPIMGILPGDQVNPCVNFTTNGGYIVCQDYWIDGNGLGIRAMRLKNDFSGLSGTGPTFLVNSVVAGDQENGQVSMLNNGAAVFAWQGGSQTFEHIYARFLSPSNSWLTGDVMVNTATNRYQSSPVVATLLNGNVVIAYSSVNQAAPGSMADVYFQMFAPNGTPIGSETLVNQFTPNNQRSPAITALANGDFAIAWVSEQENRTDASNGVPSVDIYARVFNPDGTSAATYDGGGEFLINVSSNVCAYPALAAATDGGFMAAWMEKDLVVLNNGWDIYARRISNVGVGGNVTRVNTQLYGDQYSPKICRAGANYLAVWTSMGQDGSREGVFGSYLNDDATTSGSEFQVNTTTFGSQMQQTLASDGLGRFLAAWTSFGFGINGFDLYAQEYIDPSVSYSSTNITVFNTDPNANPYSVSNVPVVVPPALAPGTPPPLVAVYNTFNDVKGTYVGLVYDPNNVNTADAGYVTIVTTASGGFTAKLQIGTKSYPFSGQFSASGTNTTQAGPWTVNLVLNLQGGYSITGQISNGNMTAQLLAYLASFNKLQPTPLAGNYTMVIHPGNGATGTGIGTVSVDTAGDVNCSLTLADGTKVTEKTTLSGSGQWPLYAAPYKGGGVLIGWVQFTGAASDGFAGQCVWTKPAGASQLYSGGLTNAATVQGSQYQVPPSGFQSFGKSQIVLNGGGLAAPITNSVVWGADNRFTSTNKLSLSLTTKTGMFTGSVVNPATGRSVPFQGVLYEKGNVGLGFFPGANQSGGVNFAPNN